MNYRAKPQGVCIVFEDGRAVMAHYLNYDCMGETCRSLLRIAADIAGAEALVCGGDILTIDSDGNVVRAGTPAQSVKCNERNFTHTLCKYNLSTLFIFFQKEGIWRFCSDKLKATLIEVRDNVSNKTISQVKQSLKMQAAARAAGCRAGRHRKPSTSEVEALNASAAKAEAMFNTSMKRRDRKNSRLDLKMRWQERMAERVRKYRREEKTSLADQLRILRGQVKLEMLPSPGTLNYADPCKERKRK